MESQLKSYSLVARLLHWVNALLILILLFSAEAAGDSSGLGYQMHISLGVATLGFTVVQILWYIFGPKPVPLSGLSTLRKRLFQWNHHLLLLTALFATVTGAIIVWGNGGVFGEIHEASAVPIVLLLLMHLAGVFYYQFFKGNTLERMAPMLFGKSGES